MKSAGIVLFALSLAGGPGMAQEIDPIGDLLSGAAPPPPAGPTLTPGLPDGSAQVPVPVANPVPAVDPPPPVLTEKPADVVISPVDEAPKQPRLDSRPAASAPVHIDETGRTPDAPPTPSDLNYESRLRATYNAAQMMQGPLDGGWILRAGGDVAYDLQLVDKGRGSLEGAWRDPRRRGGLDSSGFIDEIRNDAGRLILRFRPKRNSPETVEGTFEVGEQGQWSGEVVDRGSRYPATLSRF